MSYENRYYKAIVADPTGFKKYRNIPQQAARVEKFVSFIQKSFPQATHINFYHLHNREFSHQVKITR